MLVDPRVNFAISKCGHKAGLDHLGVQVESEAELNEMQVRLANAEVPMVTIARWPTDTFAGIRPLDAPDFIISGLVGGGITVLLFFGSSACIARSTKA
jgi:hypothetical protein